METQRVSALIRTLGEVQSHPELGPEMTVRQLLILLLIARAGNAGTDFLTLQNKTRASQSSVSRTVLRLGVKNRDGLIRAELDPNDHRARVLYLTSKGNELLDAVD